jgi:hypothetical protein
MTCCSIALILEISPTISIGGGIPPAIAGSIGGGIPPAIAGSIGGGIPPAIAGSIGGGIPPAIAGSIGGAGIGGICPPGAATTAFLEEKSSRYGSTIEYLFY